MPSPEFGLRLAHPEQQVSQKGDSYRGQACGFALLGTALRCWKGVAGKATRVYHPLVFLVDE